MIALHRQTIDDRVLLFLQCGERDRGEELHRQAVDFFAAPATSPWLFGN